MNDASMSPARPRHVGPAEYADGSCHDSVIAMPLGAAGSVLVDPRVLGTEDFRFPGDPRLMSLLADAIFDAIWDMRAESPDPLIQLPMLRSRMAAVIGIALATLKLVRDLEAQGQAGFVVNRSAPALDFFDQPIDRGDPAGLWRAFIQAVAVAAQRIGFAVIDIIRLPRPLIQVSTEPVDPAVPHRWRWRLRAFRALLGRPRDVSDEEVQRLTTVARNLGSRIVDIARRHGVPLRPQEQRSLQVFLVQEMTIAYKDYCNFCDWLGRRRFNFFGGSVTGFGRAVLAALARASGGRAHSTVHGGNVYGNTFAPNIMELLNASDAWMPSAKAASNAREIMNLRCSRLMPCAIHIHATNELLQYDRPTAQANSIRTVVVLGSPVVLQMSAVGALQAPCYVDVEKRMTSLLVDNGYRVIYKPHPDNTWDHHREILDPRVEIECRRYEALDTPFEAVIYVFHISSTLITDLGSSRHVFLLADGWHESFWLEGTLTALKRRCQLIPGNIDERGRIVFDETVLLRRLANPKPVDRAGFYEFIGAEARDVMPDGTTRPEPCGR